MPRKIALIEYQRCQPELCDGGVCAAAQACPHKLLRQETLYQAPMPNPSLCQGCAKCVVACPPRAVVLM